MNRKTVAGGIAVLTVLLVAGFAISRQSNLAGPKQPEAASVSDVQHAIVAKAPQNGVKVTPQTEAAKGQALKGGVVVAIDPETGKIRPMDASDYAALEAQAQAQAGRSAADRKLTKSAEPATFAGPGNSIGMKLDDSQMIFSVVHKGSDGKLIEDSVKGKAAANQAVLTGPKKKETLNDR